MASHATGHPTYGTYLSESEAIQRLVSVANANYTGNGNTGCSVTFKAIDHDIYPISYDVGIKIGTLHSVTGTYLGHTDAPVPCQTSTVASIGLIGQQRMAECPGETPGESQWRVIYESGNPATPYCAKRWTVPHKPPSPKMCKGNPCEPIAGIKIESITDYQGAGAFPLRFARTFRSDSAFADANSTSNPSPDVRQPVGIGWSASYFQRIDFHAYAGRATAVAYRPDGDREIFNEVGGNLVPDADNAARLTRLLDGVAR